jgi:hypothetical protein
MTPPVAKFQVGLSAAQWAAAQAAESPRFRAQVDRLRELARVSRVTLGRTSIAAHAFDELEQLLQREAWSDYALVYLEKYIRRCRRLAGQHLYDRGAASRVHELAQRASGYDVAVAPGGPPAPVGAIASTLAADQAGRMDWKGGATSCREQRYQFTRRLETERTFKFG